MNVGKVLRLSSRLGQNLVRSIFKQVIKTGLTSGLTRDTVLTTYSGDDIFVSATISPIKNSGEITGVVIIFRDVTKLRRMEKEFEEEHSNLLAIFQAAPVGLVILDNNLIIKRVNTVLLNFTGKSEDSLINKCIGSGIGCINSTQSPKGCGFGTKCKLCDLSRIASYVNDTGLAVYGEELQHSVLIGENKVNLWLRVNSIPILINENKYVMLAVNNFTEYKQLQENLKQSQSQMVQQEKLAAIGQLAAGVAHEINNPLGFVISNVETLEKYCIRLKEIIERYVELKGVVEEADFKEAANILYKINDMEKRYNVGFITDDLKALLNDINDGLNRINKIVLGFRVFSRVDNPDELTDYDLNAGIENTIMVANNEIKFYADIKKNLGDIPLVELSGSQINQVLLNVIINAIHAIKEGQDGHKGLINITTYKNNRYVCCDIEDNGIGIPEENLGRIFDPFFTTKPVGQGTGLGLSISYDIIVNKYGGEMSVKSTPGKGTVFGIRLPFTGE